MPGQSTRKTDGGRIPGAAAVANGLEIKLNFLQRNGKSARCFLHAKWLPPVVVGQALAESIANAMQPQWTAHIGAIIVTGTFFENVTIRDMTDPSLPEFTSTGAAVQGTDTTVPLPPDVALCVTENTITRGRGARGRFFLMGFGSSAQGAGGTIATTTQTAVNALGSAWQSGLRGLNIIPSVAKPHRQEYTGLSGALHPERPARLDEVTAYVCRDLNWDTQRRRDIV